MLERRSASHAPFELSSDSLQRAGAKAWMLGAPEIDHRLAGGLNACALHEVKPEARLAGIAAGGWAAALGFALRLAVRRLDALGATPVKTRARILWCWPSVLAREIGHPCAQGFSALGATASSCLFVETARATDALWAMEEGLRSASLALVIGAVSEAALTPARRLSLAAAEHATPCLLITDPRTPAAGSTATRWRIGARASAPNPFEPGAPGASRYAVALERCHEGGLAAQACSLLLEWSHETHRFRVAPAVADRTAGPRVARRRAG
jgi:protein ImuA